MRNTIRFAIVFVLLVQTAFAQENISNKFYFKYAISTPTNSFAEYGEWKDESNYKKGGAIEIGSYLYFKNLDLGPKFKLGFDVSYLSVSKHVIGSKIDLGDMIDPDDELDFGLGFDFGDELDLSSLVIEPKVLFYNIGSKIGPVVTYNVWDKLNLDVFAKVNPIWMNGAIEDNQDGSALKYYTGSMGFKYSFGMNVRYDFVVLGAEFNTGNLKYQSQDDKNIYLGNMDMDTKPEQTKSPSFNLSLGFCF